MAFVRLMNLADPPFRALIEAQRPCSVRFEEAIAESAGTVSIWLDNLHAPRVALQEGRGWLSPLGEEKEVLGRLEAIESLAAAISPEENHLRLSALHRPLRDAIAARRRIVRETPCGLYTLSEADFTPFRAGPHVESLRDEDAPTLARHAEHSENSPYCAERIRAAPTTAVRVGGTLAAYMIVHENGSIGMLYTVEAFRNRKLGRLVASALAERQIARGRKVYCYILDGNTASQRVFGSLGFKRAADVSWIVFERGEGAGSPPREKGEA